MALEMRSRAPIFNGSSHTENGHLWKNNTIFNNISVISLRSVLLVEETGVPGENHQSGTIYIMLYQVILK